MEIRVRNMGKIVDTIWEIKLSIISPKLSKSISSLFNRMSVCLIKNQRKGVKTMRTAVIYARYSSERQTEQSIEGQIRECTEFAERR